MSIRLKDEAALTAASATKLATARTIALSGDVTGSVTFDGSANATITTAVADDSHNHTIANVDGLQSALNAKAPLASPAFTGTPTAPTAGAGTNTTQVATTAFVTTAVNNKTSVSGNAGTATKLQNARTIAVTGALSGSASFDGSANASIAVSSPNKSGAWFSGGAVTTGTDGVTEVGKYIDFHLSNTSTTDYDGRLTLTGNNAFDFNGGTVKAGSFTGSLSGNASTATKATQDSAGQQINTTYIKGLSVSGRTITYTKGDGSTGTITTQDTDTNTDTKVTNTLATTTKAYVTGTTSATTNTGTQVFDTGVYLDTTAGKLTATTFAGALSGNATTATTLQTARTINGTSFNGSGNITTANWGTAREIKIADSDNTNTGAAVSVNGATGHTLKLPPTIKATLTGNASTATKLATARTISLTGDVTGSASFDGSANVSISATNRRCVVGQNGSTTTNPYYKFASIVISSANEDREIAFKVSTGYGTNTASGILRAHVRSNSTSILSHKDFYWEYANAGIDPSKFVMAYNADALPVTVELWAKVDTAYMAYHFDVLQEHDRGTTRNRWTLYNTVSVGSASAITSGYTQVASSLLAIKNTVSSVLPLAGGTMTGYIGIGTYGLKGANGGIILRDHGKNVTLSASTDASGNVGDLYLGYNTGEFYTNTVRLERQLTWKGSTTLVDSNGKLQASQLIGTASVSTTGNASTATTLQTARTINGTSFNGSANITTANWGTARTLTIGNTGKSVNGSGNVSWSLSEIGAAAASHTHNYAGSSSAGGNANAAVKLATARTINGTNFDGTANISFGRLEPINIAANTNLNSIQNPGMYYCPATATATTLPNCPVKVAFSLLVEKHAGIKQTITEYVQNGVPLTYIRNYYNGTWGKWYGVPMKQSAYWSNNSTGSGVTGEYSFQVGADQFDRTQFKGVLTRSSDITEGLVLCYLTGTQTPESTRYVACTYFNGSYAPVGHGYLSCTSNGTVVATRVPSGARAVFLEGLSFTRYTPSSGAVPVSPISLDEEAMENKDTPNLFEDPSKLKMIYELDENNMFVENAKFIHEDQEVPEGWTDVPLPLRHIKLELVDGEWVEHGDLSTLEISTPDIETILSAKTPLEILEEKNQQLDARVKELEEMVLKIAAN